MQALGIQPLALLAQIVNFLIILWLLKKFLYGPVLKIIQDRQKKITKSMDDVEKIEQRLAKLEKTVQQKITTANQQADQILKEAKLSSKKIQKQAQSQAEKESQKIITQAEDRVKAQEKQMITKVETKISDLAVSMAEKILQGLDTNTKSQITKNSLKQISKTLN